LGFFLGPFALLTQQGVQHRQQEGSGFAATGLAGDHQVAKTIRLGVVHGHRNGARLYGRGLGKTEVVYCGKQLGGKPQLGKSLEIIHGGTHRLDVGVFHRWLQNICHPTKFYVTRNEDADRLNRFRLLCAGR